MVSIKKAILFLLKAFILFQTKKSAELLIRPSSKQEITLLKSPLASITDRGNNNNKEETASLLNLFNEETEVVKITNVPCVLMLKNSITQNILMKTSLLLSL